MSRIQKVLGALVLAALSIAASCNRISVVTLYAQTLPVTKTLAWDANPPADAVINYTVRLDGVVIGSPTGPTQAFTVTTAGAHALAVTATNAWGTSPATTLNFNVVLPGAVGNVRIQ